VTEIEGDAEIAPLDPPGHAHRVLHPLDPRPLVRIQGDTHAVLCGSFREAAQGGNGDLVARRVGWLEAASADREPQDRLRSLERGEPGVEVVR